jgi:acyl-CoA synthetase (AMP-forming)/AMP-acid ligase II
VLSTLVTAQAGGCSIVMDRRDCAGVAEWIQRGEATVWNGAPAQLFDLARRADLDLSPVTEVWVGGAGFPGHLRDSFEARHGIPVTATYGLSEAPTVVAIDPVDGPHRPGSSGRVLPHLTVAAYDDDGRPLAAGGVGELRLSAATAGPWAGRWRPPLGYWDGGALRPAAGDMIATDGMIATGGMVATGDIGHVDADGWLTILDRKKLMIVRGGANVSPAEVEAVLAEHPRSPRPWFSASAMTASVSASRPSWSRPTPLWTPTRSCRSAPGGSPATRSPRCGAALRRSPATRWTRSPAATLRPCCARRRRCESPPSCGRVFAESRPDFIRAKSVTPTLTSNPYKDGFIVAGWTSRWDPVPRRFAPSCASW